LIKNNLKNTILFSSVAALFWFSLYTYPPILPPYAQGLGVSPGLIGMIVGSYGFTQMVFRIPLGIFSDLTNARKIFVAGGILCGAVSCIGLYFAEQYIWLVFFRGLSGVAASTWVIFTVLFASFHQDATRAIGIVNVWSGVGQVIAMLIGGIVANVYGSPSSFLLGAAGGIVALGLSLMLSENVPDNEGEVVKVDELVAVGKNLYLLIVSGLAVIYQVLVYATVYGFTPIVARAVNATDFEIGLMATLSVLPRIASAALSGLYLAKIWGETKTVSLGFLLMAFSSVLVPYVQTVEQLYLLQIVGGFGQGLILPMLMALSIKSVPHAFRSTAMGVFQAVYAIGMFLGPVIVGFIIDNTNIMTGFWVTALFGLFGAIMAIRVK